MSRFLFFFAYFEILYFVLRRFQKLFKQSDLFVCDVSAIGLD